LRLRAADSSGVNELERELDEETAEPSWWDRYRGVLLLLGLLAILLAVVGAKWASYREQSLSSSDGQARSSDLKLSIVPGLPPLTIRKGSLYPADDPWADYLASEQTCPGGERTDLPLEQQAAVMVCLVNYARQRRGLGILSTNSLLGRSSLAKTEKIVRCGQFAHDACGEDPVADARAAGYQGAWGENIYLGEGRLGAPRVALDGWLNSPEHRDNLFQPGWLSEGIAVMKVARFDAYSDVTIWVNQFATG
jgi:uncharacterized protein YkwD